MKPLVIVALMALAGELLGADERAALNRRLFGRVLDVTLTVFRPDRVIIVTAARAHEAPVPKRSETHR